VFHKHLERKAVGGLYLDPYCAELPEPFHVIDGALFLDRGGEFERPLEDDEPLCVAAEFAARMEGAPVLAVHVDPPPPPPTGPAFVVFVKTLNGKTITLYNMHSNTPVEHVKLAIEGKEGEPGAGQREGKGAAARVGRRLELCAVGCN
jgi:hypothetical protein